LSSIPSDNFGLFSSFFL